MISLSPRVKRFDDETLLRALQEQAEAGGGSPSSRPLLVVFHGPNCAPCAKLLEEMAPAIEEQAAALEGPIPVLVDAERFTAAASGLGVRTLPTVILFANGRPFSSICGRIDHADFLRRLKWTGP